MPTDSFRAIFHQQNTGTKDFTRQECSHLRNAVIEFPASGEGGDGWGYFH